MDGWFYVRNGATQGPVTLAELRGRFAAGELPPDAWVWNPAFGSDQWRPITQTEAAQPAPSAPAPQHAFHQQQPPGGLNPQPVGVQPAVAGAPAGFVTPRPARSSSKHPGLLVLLFLAGAAAGVVGTVAAMNSEVRMPFDLSFLGLGLPACDSSIARSQVRSLFDSIQRNANITARDQRNTSETSASSSRRDCRATVAGSDSRDYGVSYTIDQQGGSTLVNLRITN